MASSPGSFIDPHTPHTQPPSYETLQVLQADTRSMQPLQPGPPPVQPVYPVQQPPPYETLHTDTRMAQPLQPLQPLQPVQPVNHVQSMQPVNPVGSLNYPDQHQGAAIRGVLAASAGSIRWGWGLRCSNSDGSSSLIEIGGVVPGPPGPPESIVLARRFACGVCSNISYVQIADAKKTYIKCPFCNKISTTNHRKTEICGCVFYSVATSLILTGIILLAVLISMEGFKIKYLRIGVLSFVVAWLFKIGSGYKGLKRSSLDEEYIRYLPSVDEVSRVKTRN